MRPVYRSLLVALVVVTLPVFAAGTAATAPTRYLLVGADRIAYRSVGTGKPMILVTRMRGTLDTWDPLFIDELAKKNRIITVDYPGVGYSDGNLPPSIGQAADFVIAFADAMKLDKFILMGWSWGGTVTQTVVVDHPGRVTHAILVATAPPGKRVVEIQRAFIDRAFKPVNDLDDETVLFFEPRSDFSRRMAKDSRDRIRMRQGVDQKIPSTAEAIKAYLAAAEEYHVDAAGRLQKLKVTRTPLLIISGDNDISTAVENWFSLNRKLPNSQLVVYPEAGHAPQHQYPQLAAEQVASFLRHAVLSNRTGDPL